MPNCDEKPTVKVGMLEYCLEHAQEVNGNRWRILHGQVEKEDDEE